MLSSFWTLLYYRKLPYFMPSSFLYTSLSTRVSHPSIRMSTLHPSATPQYVNERNLHLGWCSRHSISSLVIETRKLYFLTVQWLPQLLEKFPVLSEVFSLSSFPHFIKEGASGKSLPDFRCWAHRIQFVGIKASDWTFLHFLLCYMGLMWLPKQTWCTQFNYRQRL